MCLAEYEVKRQKESGNDVLTMQPMDWPAELGGGRPMDRLVGDDYSELQDLATTLTR
jgi:hypothetical protein